MLPIIRNLQENQYSVFETKYGGFKITFSNPKWKINESIMLNLDSLKIMGENFIHVKTTLAYFAMNYSASYTKKMFYAMKHFLKLSDNVESLFAFNNIRFYFGKVSPLDYTHTESMKYLLLKMHTLFPSLLSSNSVEFITEIEIIKKLSGKYLKTHNYQKGPFNDTQIKKILELTARAYQVERISLSNYLMLLLLIYTGRRPMQIAQLETGDLFKLDGVFYINIPKVKQRGAYRKQFSKVQIPQNLFENLTYLINAVKSIVSETLNTKLNEKQKNKLPIFLNTYHFKNNTVTLDMIENGELKLSSYQVTTKIRRTINRSIGKLQIDFGEINSRRFRYTLGTKAAQMGYSPSLIANILDHSSTSSVMSYVHNTAENSRKINEAMNEFIKPIAKKFTEKNSAERELVVLKDLIDKYFFASECESISFDSAINLLIKDGIDSLFNDLINYEVINE